ncbi:esterase [Heterostelium album PN500]|uniref:S-formylglutathione hydrolase n=1 Tax=Heterostelium pallidum (strain ATCC 26659 / Pp 5 / PN500) TaxID=670386 RepID=D3B6X6_HETP5|nr:esterase [Heterostelium album PN500]EFA82519.1 esterase [Heterostelium album PN500]|eukprot:XP_020434636.1 esterase [Heterostelium album PN500]
MSLQLLSTSKCYNGEVKRYSHQSKCNNCEMKFHVYLPATISKNAVPVLWFLSGITCTDENFITKSCALQFASREGIMLVCPDTSPRGAGIEGEQADWTLGLGAGFYVDATNEPWSNNYNMYTYITSELYDLVSTSFNIIKDKQSIFGHSMGGHGALISAFKNPSKYRSVSAFAPICNPVTFGENALTHYLGGDKTKWDVYNASVLAKSYQGPQLDILVDQGTADDFLYKLYPDQLIDACKSNSANINLTFNHREGYPHNYWFIQTFIEDHIVFHSKHLN